MGGKFTSLMPLPDVSLSTTTPTTTAQATETADSRTLGRLRAELAARQHGVVHRDQLLALGYSRRQLSRDLANGLLHRVAESVYAVGHPGLSRRGRGLAALLHAGPQSALSHQSAERVWEIADNDGKGPIHVSIIDRRGLVAAPNTVLHRPRTLTPEDIVERRGLRVTTIERTLLDGLGCKRVPEVIRTLERVVTVHNRSPDDLHAWAAGDLGRVPGLAKLHEALDSVVGPAVIRSRLEEEFRLLCAAAGLPLPLTNVRLGRWELDVLFQQAGVVIELDSWRFHGGHWQFHRDRDKGLFLAGEGYEVIRLTWRQVTREREVVAAILHRVLTRRGGLAA